MQIFCLLRQPVLLWCLTGLGMLCWPVRPAYPAGSEETRRGADLIVTSSTVWCGCRAGGYYPIRLGIVNRGNERTVTIRFVSSSSNMPIVQRTMVIAQNASIKTSLPIPMVSSGTHGTLNVLVDGNLVRELTRSISLPDSFFGGMSPSSSLPSMLIISPAYHDTSVFENAYMLRFGHGAWGPLAAESQTITPTLLPENWLDYSGVDLVALSLDTLSGLNTAERNALLHWVETGGNLIIDGIGSNPDDSPRLNQLLRIQDRAFMSDSWMIPNENGRLFSTHEDSPFMIRKIMSGIIIAFPGEAFPGTHDSWDLLLQVLGGERQLVFAERMGLNARARHPEFLNFLIPSIQSVPVTSFLVLITLFSIVIGPVNYFLLWKRARLQYLVITIPLIAIVTSFVLLSYSIISQGFWTRARVRSLTYLDQRTNNAVCISRVSLYSGMAPSDGLRFQPETAVYPIWPNSENEPGRVDWTSTQHFSSGWLKSRTRTQFVTQTHRNERGRIEFTPTGSREVQAINGLEWDIDTILVKEADGQIYHGTGLTAGNSRTLTVADSDQLQEVGLLIEQFRPAPPAGALPTEFDYDPYGYSSVRYSYPYYEEPGLSISFQSGSMERQLAQFRNLSGNFDALPPRSYVAVLRQSPGCDIGIEGASLEASLFVLFGRY